jgi:two-component system cell cycle sensor histidine kinase/response regulator CckA
MPLRLASPGQPPRILIVDDERPNRQLLELMLAAEGCVFQTAADGNEALALVAQQPPDLILLDIMMPGMDGYQVATHIKASAITRHIPIIIITSLDDHDARVLGLTAGADDVLTKPVDRAELCVRVRNLLRPKACVDHHDRYSQMLEAEVAARTAALVERTTSLEQRAAANLVRVDNLQRHAILLHEAEERTTFALGAAGMGLWELDMMTEQLTWSDTMVQAFGLTAGEAPTNADAYLALIHPDDREMAAASMAAVAERGSDYMVEFRVVWPDGTVHWLEERGRLFRAADGRPARLLGVGIDISERKVREAQARQTSKMEAIGRLASGVAHDFNNLLTVIVGFTEMVANDAVMMARHGNDLDEILKAGRRAMGLTRQLLAFSRQQVLQFETLDVNALITDMTAMLPRLIGERLDIALSLAPNVSAVFCDAGQLQQVVMNLVVNASDAMPDAGTLSIETADVELESSSFDDEPIVAGTYVMLAVSDTGNGMAVETQHRIFEPFFTTKEAVKSTGLGLSTTYGIVKQSNGYIKVYSELGLGTTFKVYLPRSDGELPVRDVVVVHPPALTALKTVLLVEDEAGVRLLSKRILNSAGYRVLDAPNGDEAESLFADHAESIDLVLTDVVMPGCGGPELLRRLRLHAPELRVLYMSGYTEQAAAQKAGIGRGLPFIQKPFTAAALVRHVRDAFDRGPGRGRDGGT